MIVYLDLVFILNSVADALALYVTARLSGLSLRPAKMLVASLVGGLYGVVCSFPGFYSMGSFFGQILVAVFLVWYVFGVRKIFLRIFLLFFVLSCAMGGVFIAFARQEAPDSSYNMNWKVFFLVGGVCYFLLSIVFRGSAKHFVSGEICTGSILCNGKTVSLNILIDTGHTLCDPYSGKDVMIVWVYAIRDLWNDEEWEIVSGCGSKDVGMIYEKLSTIAPGKYWLIPYRAVGVESGSLICFAAENVVVGEKFLQEITVALSFTPLSDGGSCNALWGNRLNEGGCVQLCEE